VRLAALDLREISGVDLEVLGLDPGISVISVFHLNSRVLTFCLMSPFCANSVEFMFLDARRNSWRTLF